MLALMRAWTRGRQHCVVLEFYALNLHQSTTTDHESMVLRPRPAD